MAFVWAGATLVLWGLFCPLSLRLRAEPAVSLVLSWGPLSKRLFPAPPKKRCPRKRLCRTARAKPPTARKRRAKRKIPLPPLGKWPALLRRGAPSLVLVCHTCTLRVGTDDAAATAMTWNGVRALAYVCREGAPLLFPRVRGQRPLVLCDFCRPVFSASLDLEIRVLPLHLLRLALLWAGWVCRNAPPAKRKGEVAP